MSRGFAWKTGEKLVENTGIFRSGATAGSWIEITDRIARDYNREE